jgi:hypothetical protein
MVNYQRMLLTVEGMLNVSNASESIGIADVTSMRDTI